MQLIDLITLIITVLNSLFVAILSLQNIKREKQEKIKSKKKVWYQTEVISSEKINEHFKTLETILKDKSDKLTVCQKLNSCMLDFFYSSINYITFFDEKYCEQIKKQIMAAMDGIIYTVVYSENGLSERDKEKTLKIYRIKIMSMFYELDLQLEK